jgi:hypothetical protein
LQRWEVDGDRVRIRAIGQRAGLATGGAASGSRATGSEGGQV